MKINENQHSMAHLPATTVANSEDSALRHSEESKIHHPTLGAGNQSVKSGVNSKLTKPYTSAAQGDLPGPNRGTLRGRTNLVLCQQVVPECIARVKAEGYVEFTPPHEQCMREPPVGNLPHNSGADGTGLATGIEEAIATGFYGGTAASPLYATPPPWENKSTKTLNNEKGSTAQHREGIKQHNGGAPPGKRRDI